MRAWTLTSALAAVVLLVPGLTAQVPVEPPQEEPKPAPIPEPDAEWKRQALADPARANLTAPAEFRVRFETTKGSFTVLCRREWAPRGVDRFYNLVQMGYFEDVAFFRAVKNFVVQFGIHGDPAVNSKWMMNRQAHIPADPVKLGNQAGVLTFAQTQDPNSRTVQLFINLKSNTFLDRMSFSGIGKVEGEGLQVVRKLYTGYGEQPTSQQGRIAMLGNAALRDDFPKLDYIKRCRVLPVKKKEDAGAKPEDEPGQEKPEDALLAPERATLKAPDRFRVRFRTSEGSFIVRCERAWAPRGVDRFYNLVKLGYFKDVAFFRAVPGFVVQFGIHGRPEVNQKWMLNRSAWIKADPVKLGNEPGVLTFAQGRSPDTRSVQLFVNLKDNTFLDRMSFAGIGKVEGDGMKVVRKLHTGYAEAPTSQQMRIAQEGNAYLRKTFPELDYIQGCELLPEEKAPGEGAKESDGAPRD